MKKHILLFCAVIFLCKTSFSQNGSSLINNFLASLTNDQRDKALYNSESEERYNWHFVPKQDRKGIMFKELNEKQRATAFSILKFYLSDRAYNQTQEIIEMEKVLQQLENRTADDWFRDPGRYSFIFFGTPSENKAWGWRFEGHHISFSFSSINNKLVSATPGFLGVNPATILTGPNKGKQVLKDEVEIAFAFMQSLTKDELSKAVINNNVPGDIITGTARKAMIEKPVGIMYNQLNKQQQAIFLKLLNVYVSRYTTKFAEDLMLEIKDAGLNNFRLAWIGNYQPTLKKPYYYRIQGPTIIIELDNIQNDANHIHTVIRDLKHDFGGDELLNHYHLSHKQ